LYCWPLDLLHLSIPPPSVTLCGHLAKRSPSYFSLCPPRPSEIKGKPSKRDFLPILIFNRETGPPSRRKSNSHPFLASPPNVSTQWPLIDSYLSAFSLDLAFVNPSVGSHFMCPPALPSLATFHSHKLINPRILSA